MIWFLERFIVSFILIGYGYFLMSETFDKNSSFGLFNLIEQLLYFERINIKHLIVGLILLAFGLLNLYIPNYTF